MTRIIINNFSCIDEADIELANLTIIIGPQASGKSVISKLIYFFHEILLNQSRSIEEMDTLDAYKKDLDEKFRKWFPQSAWGNERFLIRFVAGPFMAQIERPSIAKTKINKLCISFSDFFTDEYNSLLEAVKEAIKKQTLKNPEAALEAKFTLLWKMQNISQKKIADALEKDSLNSQIFVPAGRSFFTSVGKGFAVFEQSGAIDPVTIAFGRLFSYLHDDRQYIFPHKQNPAKTAYQKEFRKNLLGGEIERQRGGKDYLVTDDKRKIPLAFTSSGQQELFPLWLVLEYVDKIQHNSKERKNFLFIEEPEAHLFPTAQSILIEYIASLTVDGDNPSRILITTHSPYILAQANNLLKAGMLSKKMSSSTQSQINKIIRKESWLKPNTTIAYAIKDKKTVPIISDEDGLIDASYIDMISADISNQFDALLEIEYNNEK